MVTSKNTTLVPYPVVSLASTVKHYPWYFLILPFGLQISQIKVAADFSSEIQQLIEAYQYVLIPFYLISLYSITPESDLKVTAIKAMITN